MNYYGSYYDENSLHANQLDGTTDFGPNPLVIDLDEIVSENETFRTALWTGTHMQLTMMNIPVGGEIGLELHEDVDQFIKIEDGYGTVMMGTSKNNLSESADVSDDSAIIIPAGTWHNLKNTGDEALKLYSIYAPPHHPFGTVQQTKADEEQS